MQRKHGKYREHHNCRIFRINYKKFKEFGRLAKQIKIVLKNKRSDIQGEVKKLHRYKISTTEDRGLWCTHLDCSSGQHQGFHKTMMCLTMTASLFKTDGTFIACVQKGDRLSA